MGRILEVAAFAAIRIYRYTLSPALTVGFGIRCRYEESCSAYAERVIRQHGFLKGFFLGIKRFVSCNPLTHP